MEGFQICRGAWKTTKGGMKGVGLGLQDEIRDKTLKIGCASMRVSETMTFPV